MRLRFVFPLLFAACAPSVSLDGAACPCADGWVCCEGSNVCAAEAARCPPVAGPDVRPTSVELGVDRRFRFTGATDGVRWSVEEGTAGGFFEAPGVYATPSTPGTYHVLAQANGGTTRITVEVRPLRVSVLAGEPGGPTPVPIDGIGAQARVVKPGDSAVVGDWLYFIEEGPTEHLRRIRLSTRAVETLFSTTSLRPPIDGPRGTGNFTFASLLSPTPEGDVLMVDGSCIRVLRTAELELATLTCPMTGVRGLAATTTHVYWTTQRDVRRLDRATGAIEVFVDEATGQFRLPGRLALAGNVLLALDDDGQALRSIDLSTRALQTLEPARLGVRYADLEGGTGDASGPDYVALRTDGLLKTRGSLSFSPLLARSISLDPSEPDVVYFSTTDSVRALRRSFLQEVVIGRPVPGDELQLDGVGASARFVFQSTFVSGPPLATRGDTVWLAEPSAHTVRTVERDGTVTTRFTNTSVTSLAVDDTHVYAIDDQWNARPRLLRAPRLGGPWSTLPHVFSERPVSLLGVLDDGRIACLEGSSVRFFDAQTGERRPERISVPPAGVALEEPGEQGLALDPAGALWVVNQRPPSLVRRVDLSSGAVETRGAGVATSGLTFSRGALFQSGPGRTLQQNSRVFVWKPSAMNGTLFFGDDDMPLVRPGPLADARVQSAASMATLWNGDLVITDIAENVVLVVE